MKKGIAPKKAKTINERFHFETFVYIVNIRHPMRWIPIYIASDGLLLSKIK